jgi:hypothetical protein
MNVFHGIKCVACEGTSTIAEWNRVTRQRISERSIGLEESLMTGTNTYTSVRSAVLNVTPPP